ncbi:MAG: AlpA family transcriptional regulator [Proteobacteria bacterium]|nr:AlpA family transcriptional regulator [Pseudomonadota bacterium]
MGVKLSFLNLHGTNLGATPADGAATQARPRDRLLRIAEVCSTTGLSRTSVYELMAIGRFPKSVRLHARMVGWSDFAVQQWIADRIAAGAQ